MKEIRPDSFIIHNEDININNQLPKYSIFLAGTIDNGEGWDWQKHFIKNICEFNKYYDLTIYNPRRKQWNPNSTIHDVEEQIKWEQQYLDSSDFIIMNLSFNSKSPISLLELGLYATSKKILVICSPDFYRKTNVRLTCEKYNIPLILDNIYSTTNNEKIIKEIFKFIEN